MSRLYYTEPVEETTDFLYVPKDYEFPYVDTSESCARVAETLESILPATIGVGYKQTNDTLPVCKITLFDTTKVKADEWLKILSPLYHSFWMESYEQRYYCGDDCDKIKNSIRNVTNNNPCVWIDSKMYEENKVLYISSVAKYKFTWSWLKSFFG